MEKNNEIEGKWIQGPDIHYGEDDELYYKDYPHTLLKHSLTIDSKKNAVFRIGCLGYYILYINGKRVGDVELNNDWTHFKKCVYYDIYDITDYLQVGYNEMMIELGNGMYNPSPLRLFGKYNLREKLCEVGQPQIICDLMMDGNLVLKSDESWNYCLGNILFNNLYLGETVDMTREEKTLYPVNFHEEKRNLVPSFIPKIKRFQTVKPKTMIKFKQGVFIDFEEMISGFISLDVCGMNNQKISLRYSENFKDGDFDYSTVLAGSVGEKINNITIPGGRGCPQYAIQTDTLICKEGINHFENKFTYHSFRYIYIEGCQIDDIKSLQAIYVHTDLKEVGKIKTDHEFLNQLYDVGLRTKLNNVHSTFEDCARERLGYGGDMVALAMSNLYLFDLEDFYKKIIMDFRFDQTKDGGIPETAPYIGIQSNGTGQGEGPILWQLVYPYLLYRRYQFYGDFSFIKQEYPYLMKQINYLLNYDIQELATRCLGDHGSVLIAGNFRKPTPDKLFLGYCSILLLLKYTILLGTIMNDDTCAYQAKYDEVKSLTISLFKNEDGSFGEGTQSGYAFAILLELDDPHILCQKFADKIKEDCYVWNSGIFGHSFAYEVLSQYGYDDIIERWLIQEDMIGYKSMLSNGNKALAELFIGDHFSLNHAMFASYQQWYYQGLAGIKIKENAVALNKIKLAPYFSQNINLVECDLETKQGMIHSSWIRKDGHIHWTFSVPENIEYEIDIDRDYQQVIKEDQVLIIMKG